MIFPLIGAVLGAILGVMRAKSLRGVRADLIQWGLIFAIIGGLLGLFAVLFIDRMMT